jgi:hypothetical protein
MKIISFFSLFALMVPSVHSHGTNVQYVVPTFPSFEVTAQIGGSLGGGTERLGVYEFDKVHNGAAAYKNSHYIVFYGGDRDGWQWVGGYYWLAGNGPAIASVPTAQKFVKYMQFQLPGHGRGPDLPIL